METPNKNIRQTIVRIISQSGASHVAASLSAVEMINCVLKSCDLEKIKSKSLDRDRLIYSKGHGAAALYSVMHHHGLISADQINQYFKNGSVMSGHASHYAPFVEHSTGALGHGLSVATGVAIGLRSRRSKSKVFTIVGDGELQEGSNWEALMLAGHLKLDRFCVLIDRNRFGQLMDMDKYCTIEPLADKLKSFNFQVREVDGHNESEILEAISSCQGEKRGPLAVICNTTKGKGVSFMENNIIWHYRNPQGADLERALKDLGA